MGIGSCDVDGRGRGGCSGDTVVILECSGDSDRGGCVGRRRTADKDSGQHEFYRMGWRATKLPSLLFWGCD